MQRQVGQHEPEAVGELLDQRLELAVRQARRSAAARAAARCPPRGRRSARRRGGGRGAASRRPIVESDGVLRRSPYDREILRLAFPALGALAAEPLYVLVDTAIVGHLGTTQLAVAGDRGDRARDRASRSSTSSPTARRRRSRGCTARAASDEAARVGAQAQWLALRDRRGAARGRSRRSPRPLVTLHGRRGRGRGRRDDLPADRRARRAAFMLASAGQGYLRGVGDLRTPLVILVVAHARQRRARAALRLRLRLGPGRLGVGDGDRAARAWARRSSRCSCAPAGAARGRADARADPHRVGDRGAHDGAAGRLPRRLGGARARRARRPRRAPDRASSCSSSSRSCSTRSRSPAQVMVGRMLGAGDAAGARAAARRMIGWSAAARRARSASLLLALGDGVPRAVHRRRPRWSTRAHADVAAVRRDDAVQRRGVRARRDPDRRRRHALPDVGDARRRPPSTSRSRCSRSPATGASSASGAASRALIVVRLATCGARFAGSRWARTGLAVRA